MIRLGSLRQEIREMETHVLELETEITGLTQVTQAMSLVHQNLSQDLSRRNDAFDSKRRECDSLMLAASLDVDRSQLKLIEVECAALAELYREASLLKTIWDHHYADFVVQIRHEKAALALRDQLESNLELSRESEASLCIELSQSEA